MTQSTAAPATGSTENTPETAVPNALNTTGSKLVYLHITTNREVTIDEIQDDLQMKKITLYSVLGTLKDNGLIEQNGDVYPNRRSRQLHLTDSSVDLLAATPTGCPQSHLRLHPVPGEPVGVPFRTYPEPGD